MTRHPSKSMAAVWMAGWLGLMVIIAVAGREAARGLHLFQVMELRSTIGFLLLYPLIHAAGGFAAMGTSRPWSHVSRNVVHYAAQYCWFAALLIIPIGQVVAIEFTMPIWIAILAAIFLGERLNPGKVTAVVLGLIGVIVIVRPATGSVEPGQLIALAAAFGFAISITIVKSLTRIDSTLTIMFWMLVIQSAIGLLPAIYVWQWPSTVGWMWIVVIAFCGTFSHYCMARALTYADATIVIPMDFLRVPLTATAGWLIYGERLDIYTVLGAVLILTGNLLNLRSAPSPTAVRKAP
ncbi:DMT family transporter [Rhodopseudomonas palustris]|uniref:DMT family transporter n=1 Tax=Rhodopseudomonas palustris TaxID=1076 RepID=A0A418VQS9_RHOPL|nr:DMT family transporter [Rhodopseudomonas palustris]RJF78693.1 DMT family transporter [Rhodopseudomonas palustris]